MFLAAFKCFCLGFNGLDLMPCQEVCFIEHILRDRQLFKSLWHTLDKRAELDIKSTKWFCYLNMVYSEPMHEKYPHTKRNGIPSTNQTNCFKFCGFSKTRIARIGCQITCEFLQEKYMSSLLIFSFHTRYNLHVLRGEETEMLKQMCFWDHS